jgi:hypothetical protein
MKYTKLTLVKRTIRKELRTQIEYEYQNGDWYGGGTYADVWEVGKYHVLTNPLNNRPIIVCGNYQEMSDILYEVTKCRIII